MIELEDETFSSKQSENFHTFVIETLRLRIFNLTNNFKKALQIQSFVIFIFLLFVKVNLLN